MNWRVRGERSIYASPWVTLGMAQVELPTGLRLDHHVIRVPQPSVGTVVLDADRQVLLIWRHRFITDRWGWEIPAGQVEPGESTAQAAAREVIEETGCEPGPLVRLCSYHPTDGLSDQRFEIFWTDKVIRITTRPEQAEVARIAWVEVRKLPDLIAAGEVQSGLSLTGLLMAMALGPLRPGDLSP